MSYEQSPTASHITFQTALRIRPLLPNEESEEITLRVSEQDPNVVKLSSGVSSEEHISSATPTKSSNFHSIRQKWQNRGVDGNESSIRRDNCHSFRFDTVLDETTNQADVYQKLGSTIVDEVTKPFVNHGLQPENAYPIHQVLFSFGVSNSGKSYSIMGGKRISRRGSEEYDGLIPRIVDDIFQRYDTNNADEGELILQISMLEVRNERVYDLLLMSDESSVQSENSKGRQALMSSSSSSSSHPSLSISHDKESDCFYVPNLSSENCISSSDSRKIISRALQRIKIRSTSSNRSSSRGHTVVIIQPVVVYGEEKYVFGGQITIVDMAGVERTKKSGVSGESMRETISINSSVGTVMNCLRKLKMNTDIESKTQTNIVPYRESKLTMLLQPALSGLIGRTSITMLVSCYPGSRDLSEKKFLLKEIHSLHGLQFDTSVCDAENIDPGVSSMIKKRKAFKPSDLIQKSPLRHIPKVIRETTSSLTPRKHFRHGESSSTPNDSKHFELENKQLLQELNELKDSNRQLSDSNRSLYEKVKELEEKLARCQSLNNEQKSSFQCNDLLEHERKVRYKKQCLIPSPLEKHTKEVFQTNEAIFGFLQKSRNNPFQLVIPTSFTLGRHEDATMSLHDDTCNQR